MARPDIDPVHDLDIDPDYDERICDECGDTDVDVFEQQNGLFLCAICKADEDLRAAGFDDGLAR